MTKKSYVFARKPNISLPKVIKGDGVYLIDSNGKKYLDASGGAAVSCLGHNPKPVINAVIQQLNEFAYAHTTFFTSEPAEALAEELIRHSNYQLDKVYFVSGGSEAVEAALKLARQYHLENEQPQRINIIGRKQSYHGNTLGALAAGGNVARQLPFRPLLGNVFHHIDPCHYWRWGFDEETMVEYGERTARQLETKILELGSKTVAAFIAEPIVGATMGAVPATSGYFKKIRQICDKYGVLLILDEVMCGMARVGSMYAWQDEEIAPDIVCIAKGLGAGIQPIGATLVTNKIYSAIKEGSGFFQHGHTYIGHSAACSAGLAILDQIENAISLKQIKHIGNLIKNSLINKFTNHPNIGDIRGRGLLLGLELVSNKDSKEAFDPNLKLSDHIKHTAMDNGLICYPGSGTIDGVKGDHVLLAPPFIFQEKHVDELVDKLAQSINRSLELIRI